MASRKCAQARAILRRTGRPWYARSKDDVRRAQPTTPPLARLRALVNERIDLRRAGTRAPNGRGPADAADGPSPSQGDPTPAIPTRERRRGARAEVACAVRLRIGELAVDGTVTSVGAGGVLLRTGLIVEPGERGFLERGGLVAPVRVVWNRTSTSPLGAGVGLEFVAAGEPEERAVLETVLAILDGG